MSSKHRKLADNPFAHLLNETTEKYSGRCDLRDLVECVKGLNEEAKAVAIIFLQRNSRGYWHNRGRAALCRYFKRNPPSKRDCEAIGNAIATKLISGFIDEQFKDQLRFAIVHTPDILRRAAYVAAESNNPIACQHADWVLTRLRELDRSS